MLRSFVFAYILAEYNQCTISTSVDGSWVEAEHNWDFVLHLNIEHILDGHNNHIYAPPEVLH